MFFYEPNRFGVNDTYNTWQCHDINFPIHLHRCFEFIYVYEGQVIVEIDNEKTTLNPEEMILIFPNQLHSYQTPVCSEILMCIFSPEYVSLFYQYSLNKKQEKIITRLNKETADFILQSLPENKENKFLIKSCLYAICSDIFEKTKLVDKNINDDITLQHKILSLIEENYQEDISLKSIAKKLGYNYQYISRYFNVQFKMPFSQMLNQRRINYAAYLIKNSDKSITEIALSCGFKSIRSFNRNFINFIHKTPSEFKII